MPSPIPSWGVAAFANPHFNDLDIPENPGSLHVSFHGFNPKTLNYDYVTLLPPTKTSPTRPASINILDVPQNPGFIHVSSQGLQLQVLGSQPSTLSHEP